MASGAVSMACYAGEVPAASSTECGTSEGPLMAELKTVAELALMSDVDMSYDDDDDDNDDGGSGCVRGGGLMKPLSDDDDDDNGMSLRLPDRFAQELSKLEAAAVAAAAASAASAEAAAAAAAAAEAAAAGPVPAAMKLEEGARSAVGYFRKITATPVPSRPPMLVQEPLTAVGPCVPRAGEEQALTGESGLPVGGVAVAAAVVVTAVEKEEDEAVVGSGGEARSRGSRRPKSFFCRPCQFTTTSEAEFRHHISSHGAKKYLLEQQGETNVRTQAHTAAGGPIRCEKCGYNTNRYDHYLAHLKHHERVAGAALPPNPMVAPLRQPNEPRPSENRENCSVVAAPVLAPASAPVVEGGATVQSGERVFRCVLCLYSTVSEYHWKKHLRNHFPRKVYTCGSCCYYSDRKNNYLQHLRTHTGERPYQCPHCSYSSSQKTHLTRHMRIHSGEKPFHCDRCTYVASNQHEVTRHLRQVHSDGPKPLVCGECGYRTADRSNYKKHVLLHTSPRRFPCPACSYAASKKCNLTYHLHSKHPTYTGTATTAATMAATTTVVTAARQQQPPPPTVSPAPPALSSSATSVKVEGASSKRSIVCCKSDTGSGGGCCTAKVNGVKREGRGRKRQGGAVAAAVAARGRAGGPPGVMGPAKETPEKKVKCEEKATAVGREASQPALPSPSSPRPPPAMMEEAGAELECEEVTSSIVKAAKRRGRRPSLKMAALAMEAEVPVGRSRRRGRKRKSKEEEQKGDDEGVKKLRNESEHVKGVVGKNAKKLKAAVRKKAESVVMENRGGGYSRKKQQRNSEKIEAVPPTRKRKTTSGGDDTNEVNGREGATTAACPPSRRRGRRSKANVVVMLAADEEGEAALCERASEPPLPPSSTSLPLTQGAILAAGVIKQEVTPPVLPIPLKNQEVNDSTGAVTLLVKQAEEVTFLTNPTQEVTSLVQCTQEATSPVKQAPEVELPVPKSQPEVPHPPALSPLRHQPPYFSLKPEATTSVASGKQTRAAQRRRLSDKPQAFSGKRSQSPSALCMHDEEGSLQSTLKPADAVTSSRPRRVPAKRAPRRKINGGRKSVAKSWARNCGPVESPDSKPQPASCEGAVAATAAVVVVTARAEEMPAAGSPPAPSPPISGARSHLATCAGPSGAAGVGFLCRFAPEPNSGRTGWNQPGSDEDRGGPRMSDAFARALQLQRVDHRQQLQQQQQHLHRLYHLRSYLVRRERSYVHSSGAFDGASWLKVGTELCGARQCREAVAAVATAPPSTPSDDGMESPLSLDSDGPFTRHDYSTAHQQQEGRPRASGDEGRGEMDEDEGIHSHDGRSSPERCFDDDEKERTGEEEEARARRKSERRRCRRRRQAFEQKPDLGGVCNVTPIMSEMTTEVVPIPPPPAALPLPPEPLQKGPMLTPPWLRPSPGRSPVTPRGPVPPSPLPTRGMCVFCDRHCHGDADYTFRLRRNLVNVYYLERETAGQNASNGDVEGDGGHCAGHHVGQGMKRAGEGDGEREGEKIAKNDGETGGKEDGERDEGNNGGRDRKKIREKDREITDDAGGKDTELERVTGDANGKEDVVSQQCGHQKRTKEQSTQTVLSREDDTQTDVPWEQDAKADAPREWCAQQDDASPKDRDVQSDASREPDAHADAYRDQDTQTYILREQYTQTDACRAPGTQARGAREQETQTDLAVETS